jgi:hypothetical protein
MNSVRYYDSPHWKSLRLLCLARDGHRCTVAGCGRRGQVADHIKTRPDVPNPTDLDVLDNLRTLCLSHDAQVKEHKGARYQGGQFKVKGCDVNGWPLDPNRG